MSSRQLHLGGNFTPYTSNSVTEIKEFTEKCAESIFGAFLFYGAEKMREKVIPNRVRNLDMVLIFKSSLFSDSSPLLRYGSE